MEVRIHWGFSCGDYSDNRKRTQQLVSEPSILGKERRLESRQFDAGITENRRKLELQQLKARSEAHWRRMDVIYDDVPRRMTSATRLTEVEEDDLIVQLRNLKQVSDIQSYIEAFDELNSRAGIEEDQALSYFLSGLIDDFQRPVRMFRPKTLSEAYSLAKLQELTVRALGVKAKGNQNNMQSSSSYYSSSKPVSVTATNKVGIMNNWNGGNKENEVDYSMKDNIRKLDSEMEDEKYADEEIDLQVEIDAFEEEEADWNHDIEKETECLPPARENAQMKELVEFEEADDAGSFFCHLAVDARAGEILGHGKVNGIELEQDTLKGNECISYARQNAQVNELYYSLTLPWLLNWFPRPTVKLKFVARCDDELYEGIVDRIVRCDDRSKGFVGCREFSIADARGYSEIQWGNEPTLVEIQSDQRSDTQHDELVMFKNLPFKQNPHFRDVRVSNAAISGELATILSGIRNLKRLFVRFPKPMVKMKLELLSLLEC